MDPKLLKGRIGGVAAAAAVVKAEISETTKGLRVRRQAACMSEQPKKHLLTQDE